MGIIINHYKDPYQTTSIMRSSDPINSPQERVDNNLDSEAHSRKGLRREAFLEMGNGRITLC